MPSGYSTTLDPVTFTTGFLRRRRPGLTGTARAAATDDASDDIPATPPATTGIDLDEETLAALQAGRSVTVSGRRLRGEREGHRGQVYSTPILLDTVTADASGRGPGAGRCPPFADGPHTLILRGRWTAASRSRSRATAVAATWQRSSGRRRAGASCCTYIEGIAHGGWKFDGVVYEYPQYVDGRHGARGPEGPGRAGRPRRQPPVHGARRRARHDVGRRTSSPATRRTSCSTSRARHRPGEPVKAEASASRSSPCRPRSTVRSRSTRCPRR